jgi:hypothetical protein
MSRAIASCMQKSATSSFGNMIAGRKQGDLLERVFKRGCQEFISERVGKRSGPILDWNGESEECQERLRGASRHCPFQ